MMAITILFHLCFISVRPLEHRKVENTCAKSIKVIKSMGTKVLKGNYL